MKVICRLHELTMLLRSGRAVQFVYGREYDLATPMDGSTLGELLGDHAASFEPVAPAPSDSMNGESAS